MSALTVALDSLAATSTELRRLATRAESSDPALAVRLARAAGRVEDAADDVAIHRQCGCGATHTARGWRGLKLIGYMGRRQGYDCATIELRNCSCGTTLAIEVEEE